MSGSLEGNLLLSSVCKVVSVVVDPVVKEVPSKVVGIGSVGFPVSRETEVAWSVSGVLEHCPLGGSV